MLQSENPNGESAGVSRVSRRHTQRQKVGGQMQEAAGWSIATGAEASSSVDIPIPISSGGVAEDTKAKGDVARNGTQEAKEEEDSRPEPWTNITNMFQADARKTLDVQLVEHSTKMEKHFSKISKILNSHLTFMVQDLDALLASSKVASESVPAIETSLAASGRCSGDQVSSGVDDSALPVPDLLATGISAQEVSAWVSAAIGGDGTHAAEDPGLAAI